MKKKASRMYGYKHTDEPELAPQKMIERFKDKSNHPMYVASAQKT